MVHKLKVGDIVWKGNKSYYVALTPTQLKENKIGAYPIDSLKWLKPKEVKKAKW